MESNREKVTLARVKRALRVRKKIRGTRDCPRLSVFKSNRFISVQLIDDENRVTLAGCSSSNKEMKTTETGNSNKDAAKKIGSKIALAAQSLNVGKVKFDRGQHKYHGVLASLADAVREQGIQF